MPKQKIYARIQVDVTFVINVLDKDDPDNPKKLGPCQQIEDHAYKYRDDLVREAEIDGYDITIMEVLDPDESEI